MLQSRGDMVSLRHALLLLTTFNFIALSRAGPLGPLPNVTSADLGLKEGSCALGDVVYMPGDEFPGSTPCEKCTCMEGGVQCARQVCEPRPGCKALHRPDHCCPTYQCECEQEGRVYGNGEKLVDPADPCRVCYCQGGEVVCRRIACFVRDDCTPRLVPGRCCPEYDNCPLRGVTSLPGLSSPIPSVSTAENVETPVSPPKENIKQEITIKEITPVSEIPVITEVKIKEILPSPSIEVAEYSSSKSPLIPREATSEKNIKEGDSKTESPSVVEVHYSSPVSSPESTQYTASENKDVDAPPSKISFSTQDSIHSSIYSSNVPIAGLMGVPSVTSEPFPVVTTKAPIIEEEDTFDHNPAFPPLPDDLAVLRNHEDEIVPEVVVDNEHVPSHDIVANAPPSTEAELKEHEPLTTTKDLPDTTTTTTTTTSEAPKTTSDLPDTTTTTSTTSEAPTPLTSQPEVSTEAPNFKESPMLNLRSAIPTEILNSPSLVPEEINGEFDEKTTVADITTLAAITTAGAPKKVEEIVTESTEASTEIKAISAEMKTASAEVKSSNEFITLDPEFESSTFKPTEIASETSTKEQEQTTSSISKSNVATEVTSQTELSSLPVETSDQNPPEVSEQTTSDKAVSSTIDPFATSTKLPLTSSEVITVSRASSNDNIGFENIETTEFILTPFGSSETATDTVVEQIKISADPEKSAAIIEASGGKKNNVLTDLINLVSDVASISDHTDDPLMVQQATTTVTSIVDSEELIPVNAGYKSKNKNFNQNSITEIPSKSKISNTAHKQKVVEIEDDESEGVTDSLPPNDKVEPTTRRPIIDNVSDDNVSNNKTNKKDIEIITQSYVPTLSRRPTKVVMKKSNEKPATASDEVPAVSASAETTTDGITSNDTPLTTSAESSASAETSPAVEPSASIEPIPSSGEPEPSATRQPDAVTEPTVTTERPDAAQ